MNTQKKKQGKKKYEDGSARTKQGEPYNAGMQ